MGKGLLYTVGLRKETFSANFANVLAIIVLVVLTVTPILFFKKYLMVLWAIYFVFSIGNYRKVSTKLKKIGVLGITYISICVIYFFIGVSSADLAYCIVDPFVYFAPILALFFVDRCDIDGQICFLFHFVSLAIAINILDSIRISHELGIGNLAFQQLAGVMADEGITGLNLGGSLFVNMVVFYSGLMFLSVLKTSRFWERLVFLVYFITGVYFIVICSMKASAIIILFLSLLLFFIANKSKRNFSKIILISVLTLAVVYLFRDSIINLLIAIIDNDRITERLEVFTSSGAVTDSNTLMNREDLWRVSLQSWLRDPITFLFGIGDHNWEDFSSTAASGVGNHSDLCDVLARYGLFGGIILYSTIKIYYDYLKISFGTYKWEILSFFIVIIIMGLTKKFVAGEPAIVIFILFPLCLKYFSKDYKPYIHI